jgi:hypothetical protein
MRDPPLLECECAWNCWPHWLPACHPSMAVMISSFQRHGWATDDTAPLLKPRMVRVALSDLAAGSSVEPPPQTTSHVQIFSTKVSLLHVNGACSWTRATAWLDKVVTRQHGAQLGQHPPPCH